MRKQIVVIAVFLALAGRPALAEPPASKPYPYTVAPEKAFAVIAKLDSVSGKSIPISDDEKSLFADAADGKLDTWSLGEACLIVSGATDPAKRKALVKKLDDWESQARAALESAKTTHEKGKKLLEFIHAGPMAKGYVTHQTNLDTLLENRTFNCVSSTVLYNVLGRRLGLDLWAVEIPEHVFACLHDGDKRADVETTNKLGFDPSRDPESRKKVMPEGRVYMAEKHAKLRREIGDLRLVAVICSNQSVDLSKQKKHQEAIRACFRTLCLDPTHGQAAKNVLAHLTNWGVELLKDEKFEQALAVIDVGLELAPSDSGLKINRKAVWQKYGDAALKAGKPAEAVAIVRRAQKTVGGNEFNMAEAELFMRRGEELLKTKGMDEALALALAGLKEIDGKPRETLLSWRNGLFLRRASEQEKKGEYETALATLQRGRALDPSFKGFQQNTAATFDAWAKTFMKKKDWAAAIEIYDKGLKQCPGDRVLSGNRKYCEQQAKKSP